MYTECIRFVQQVFASLGMASALHEAGLWDEGQWYVEEWSKVQVEAESAAEAAARASRTPCVCVRESAVRPRKGGEAPDTRGC